MKYLQIKNIVISVLQKYKNIKLVILFGSASKDKLTKWSDIDIAVSNNDKISKSLLADMQLDLEKNLKRSVDLLDMQEINGIILKQVLTTGKVLIKKDTLLHAALMKKMVYFDADMLPGIRYILKKRAQRFIDGK